MISASNKAFRLATLSPSGPSSPSPMMLSHGVSDMIQNLLLLGGTVEASALARQLSEAGVQAVMSFAGRVEALKPQPLATRVGGFGGACGLAVYIRENGITHVIDATHPFAAQMSHNAIAACSETRTPLIALTRAPWMPTEKDRWTRAADISDAAERLAGAPKRVFLAVGRMHLNEFIHHPQHFYLLRLVDQPTEALAFPDYHAIIARGPFSFDYDLALLRKYGIDLVVSKNAGGGGSRSKIDAARDLGIEVLMIDRPDIPPRHEVHSADEVMRWLKDHPTDLGV